MVILLCSNWFGWTCLSFLFCLCLCCDLKDEELYKPVLHGSSGGPLSPPPGAPWWQLCEDTFDCYRETINANCHVHALCNVYHSTFLLRIPLICFMRDFFELYEYFLCKTKIYVASIGVPLSWSWYQTSNHSFWGLHITEGCNAGA